MAGNASPFSGLASDQPLFPAVQPPGRERFGGMIGANQGFILAAHHSVSVPMHKKKKNTPASPPRPCVAGLVKIYPLVVETVAARDTTDTIS